MSEESSSPSQSLLTNLRHFRFQKKTAILKSDDESSELNGSTNDMPGSKFSSRGGSTAIYDSDDSPVKSDNCLGLRGLVSLFPSVGSQGIEKILIECEGDIEKAKSVIRERHPSAVKTSQGIDLAQIRNNFSLLLAKRKASDDNSANSQSKPKPKRFKKIRPMDEDSDEFSENESDKGYSKKKSRVFDSDSDSGEEETNEITWDQKEVFEFLSSATLGELLCMPHISRKKADAIMELRPFEGWRDMVEKFQQGKGLTADILNSAQEYLQTRQVVTQLMNKCHKLSSDLERFNETGLSAVKTQPSLLVPELKLAPYQMVGINWLVMLHQKRLNGILADEMGLGKTVQIIAFLAWLKQHYPDGQNPNLIVVPASTLDNWKNELERWCPTLNVIVYYGDKEERRVMRSSFAMGGVKKYDVVLTTYNLLTTSPEERKMFRVLKFQYVVFDEAHMLKNMKTARYEQLSKVNASHRILLTGTPLQNNLLELMSLLTFVMPEMFMNKKESLKCLFTRTKDKNDNADSVETSLPRFEQEQVAQAKKIMKPFVLRRLKKDVLKDLPTKTDLVKTISMSDRQRKLYDGLISDYSKSAAREKAEEDMSGMTMMMQLRKVANHPLLVRELYTDKKIKVLAHLLVKEPDYKETNLEYVIQDLSILSDFELHCLCRAFTTTLCHEIDSEYILDSGKFKLFDEMLPSLVKENHRILIFSQFVTMLNIMEHYLDIRNYKFLRLDGSTPVPVRQELIDTFNNDETVKVFLLSTRAGGLGINLTAADTVMIHDLDFNPYNDKQAEDRCHRVGQTKPVTVYRFVSKSTIEEDIYQIACEKLHLEKEISSEEKDVVETKKLLKKALGLDQMPQNTKPSA